MSPAPAEEAPLPTEEPLVPDPEALAALRRGRRARLPWILGGAAVLALLGGLAYALLGGEPEVPWETAPVTRGSLLETVTAVGQLEPVDSVEVGSDLSGKVLSVAASANDRVEQGAVLARLDPEPFENAAAQARATLASSRASLASAEVAERAARLDLERLRRLLPEGAATAVEVEDAELAHQSAAAATRAAQAQVALSSAALARAEDDLADTVITSPIAGVVTRRLVEPGQTVVSAMSATALFEVASDLRALEAVVEVDEADVGRVKADQPATFTVSAWPDRRFQAQVHTVDLAPSEDDSIVTYGAELRLDNADLALRPGMTATAEIEVGRQDDVLLVPPAALRYRPPGVAVGEGEWVFVLEGGAPVAISVALLGTGATQTAVRGEGLDEADSVLIGGPSASEDHGPMGGPR